MPRRECELLEAPVIEEAGERIPTLEQIIDCLAGIVMLREFGTLLAQPHLQFADKREAVLLSHAQPPLRHSMVKRASMRLTASASIGALLSRARSKSLRRP